jgi:hypothetical protein
MNREKIRSAIRHYLFGLFASSWNGAISAVAGILGVGAAAVGGVPGVQSLDARQMASAFAGAFLLHGVMWLKAHPIPTDLETNPPIPAPKL